MVLAGSGRQAQVKNCFRNLKVHEYRELGKRKVCGREHNLSAVRLPGVSGGDFVILAGFMTPEDVTDADLYLRRWNIETGFEKLKTHGVGLEDTRLAGEGKMEVLMAGPAIAHRYAGLVLRRRRVVRPRGRADQAEAPRPEGAQLFRSRP